MWPLTKLEEQFALPDLFHVFYGYFSDVFFLIVVIAYEFVNVRLG